MTTRGVSLALLLFLLSGALTGCLAGLMDVEPAFEQSSRRGYAVTSALEDRIDNVIAINGELAGFLMTQGIEIPPELQARLTLRDQELSAARDEAADAKEAFRLMNAVATNPQASEEQEGD